MGNAYSSGADDLFKSVLANSQQQGSQLFDALTQHKKQNRQNEADAIKQQMAQEHDTQKQQTELGFHREQLGETGRHNLATEDTAAAAQEATSKYHDEAIRDLAERRKIDKLKMFLGGSSGGVSGDGKPMAQEAQKASNLVDAGRSALNNTEALSRENPKTAAFVAAAPQWVTNPLSSIIGGNLKKINDSVGMTREAMQNVKTGAAATGQQAASFQNWSMPGAADILKGNVGSGSDQLRDDMNIMQQGLQKQSRTINPEAVKAAGLENDPMAKIAIEQQQHQQAAKEQQHLQSLKPEDQQLYKEIQANPAHPKATAARQYLKRQYGGNF